MQEGWNKTGPEILQKLIDRLPQVDRSIIPKQGRNIDEKKI